nr:hypothetical protein BaRGS_024223 [Batillaria attramentaria]
MFPHFFRYTIVVFTRGDVLKDMTINEAIKVADPELKKLLRDVQRRFVVFNNLEPDAGKKEETVLGLLDMVYNVYQLNEEAYFTTDQFQKAESLAASRDEEIQREAKEESKGPNADLVGILLEKISHFERKFLEQSQLMAQQNENLRTIAALAAAEKGTGAAQRYLARALNIKEVEHDKGNVPLTGLDPFALLLVAKALRTKVTDKNTSIENCQIDSQTMPQKLQN